MNIDNADDRACVGGALEIESIADRYINTPFHEEIKKLARSNAKIREVRRDGNCFYSAVIFLLLEHHLKSPSALEDLLSSLQEVNELLRAMKIEQYLVEEFTDPFFSTIKSAAIGNPIELEGLDEVFWGYTVVYFRMITSAYVRKHKEKFQKFLKTDAEEYCKGQVEASGQYAGEIEMIALAEALNLSFDIVCLEKNTVQVYSRGNGEKIGSLLYMPDHFDIIYFSV